MKFFSKLLHDLNFQHIKIHRFGQHTKLAKTYFQKNLICNKTLCCRHYSSIRKSFDLPPLPPFSTKKLNKNTVLGIVIPENSNKILYIPLDYNETLKQYVLDAEVLIEHVENTRNDNLSHDSIDKVKFVQRKNIAPTTRKLTKDTNSKTENEITNKKSNKSRNLIATSTISLKYLFIDNYIGKVVNLENGNQSKNNKDFTINFKSQFTGDIFITSDELVEPNENNGSGTKKEDKILKSESKEIESVKNTLLPTSATKSTRKHENKISKSESKEIESVINALLQTSATKSTRKHDEKKISKSEFKEIARVEKTLLPTSTTKSTRKHNVKTIDFNAFYYDDSKSQWGGPSPVKEKIISDKIKKAKSHNRYYLSKKQSNFQNKKKQKKMKVQFVNRNKVKHKAKDIEKTLEIISLKPLKVDPDITIGNLEIDKPKTPSLIQNEFMNELGYIPKTDDKQKLSSQSETQVQTNKNINEEHKPEDWFDRLLATMRSQGSINKEIKFTKLETEENKLKQPKTKIVESNKIVKVHQELNTLNEHKIKSESENKQKLDLKLEPSNYSNLNKFNSIEEQLPKEIKSQTLNENEKELETKNHNLDSKLKPTDNEKIISIKEQSSFKETKLQTPNENKKILKISESNLQSTKHGDLNKINSREQQLSKDLKSQPTNKNKVELKVENEEKLSNLQPLKPWDWKKSISNKEQPLKNIKSQTEIENESNQQPLKNWNWKKINLGEEQSYKEIKPKPIKETEKILNMKNFQKLDSNLQSKPRNQINSRENEKALKMKNLEVEELRPLNKDILDSIRYTPKTDSKQEIPVKSETLKEESNKKINDEAKFSSPQKKLEINKQSPNGLNFKQSNKNEKEINLQNLQSEKLKTQPLTNLNNLNNTQTTDSKFHTSGKLGTQSEKESIIVGEMKSQENESKMEDKIQIEESISKNKLQREENKSRTQFLEKAKDKTEVKHAKTEKLVINSEAKNQKPLELNSERLSTTKKELSVESSKLKELREEHLLKQIKMMEADENKHIIKDENRNKIENKEISKKTEDKNNITGCLDDHTIVAYKLASDTQSNQNLKENLNSEMPTEIMFKDNENISKKIPKNKNLNQSKPDISNAMLVIASRSINISENTNVKNENENPCSKDDLSCNEYEKYYSERNNIHLNASKNTVTNIVFNEMFPMQPSSEQNDLCNEDEFSDLNEYKQKYEIPIPRIDLSYDNIGQPKIVNCKNTSTSCKINQSNKTKNMKSISTENKYEKTLSTFLMKDVIINSTSNSNGSTSSNESFNKLQNEPPDVNCSPYANCSTITPASCSKEKEKTAILCLRDNACSSKSKESTTKEATKQEDNKSNSK